MNIGQAPMGDTDMMEATFDQGQQMPLWVRQLLQQQARTNETLQQQLAQVLSSQNSRNAAPTANTNERHVLPTKFSYDDSDRGLYPAFRAQLVAKFDIDGTKIGNEQAKAWYAYSRLERKAAQRMQPWVDTFKNDTTKFTGNGIVQQLDVAFADPQRKARALARLGTIKQGSRTFRDFITEFDQLMLEAQAHTADHDTRKAWLTNALSYELVGAMISVTPSDTYEGYCQQLHQVSDRMASFGTKRPYGQSRSRQANASKKTVPYIPGSTTTNSTPNAGDPMDWEPTGSRTSKRAKWVSQDEITKRRNDGRCLRCGTNGHRIASCPYLPARRPDTQVNNTNVYKPELEEEVFTPDEQGKDEPLP